MSDREIMNAKGLGKQLELFEDEKLSPKYWQVPFVDEVQEFNETFGKPNNYKPTIPEKKEWMFVYDFIQEELAEYQEVQASNMSKSCVNKSEAELTVAQRAKEQNEPCHWEQVGDRYVVYRTRDRKVMKSINYFKPNLKQFFTNEELS